jgi:hypothetical protein
MCDTCSCNTLRQSQTLDHHDVPQNTCTSDSTPTKSPNLIPSEWEPPSSPISRFFFRVMCICLTLHWDLEFMWEIFREPNGWENFHDLYLKQINQCSTVVCRCIFSVPPFLIVFVSKDWSLRLSQSSFPLCPHWNKSIMRLVVRIHSYRNRWCSRCSACYFSCTPLSWGTVIKSRKPSK